MTKRVLNKEKKRTDILDAAYELFTTLDLQGRLY